MRAEWPPFSALPGIWLAPFFNKKYMTDPNRLDSYVKCPTFLTSWYMRIFFDRRFLEAACSLGIQRIDCDICLTTTNKWVKNSFRTIMYEWIRFFKGQIYDLGRYRNTGSHTRTKITPKSLNLPPPPLPLNPEFWIGICCKMKECASDGCKVFPFTVDPFQKGEKQFWRNSSH